MTREPAALAGLHKTHFQHPSDLKATAAMEQVTGLSRVLRFISESGTEKVFRYDHLASSLVINASQYPSIYKRYVRIAEVLDVRKLPRLYLQTTTNINAYASGSENYSIVLCSGLVDILNEDELMAILGHELGHVKCEHMLYKTVAHWVQGGGMSLLSSANIPGIDLILAASRIGIEYAVMDWNRKAEFSCDRAALLATQNPEAVTSALCKLAGFTARFGDSLNVEEALKQCEELEDPANDSLIVKLHKLQTMMVQTHPYPVLRAREIRDWAESKHYKDLISGRYQVQGADKTANRWHAVQVNTKRVRLCKGCGYPSDEGFSFCPSCQSNLRTVELACTSCRSTVEDSWAACIECGAWLAGESAGH